MIKTKGGNNNGKVRLAPVKEVFKSVDPNLRGDSRIGVLVDVSGDPKAFVFNTNGFIDFLSEIDERLVDELPTDSYYSPKVNITGGIIDEIESRIPVSRSHIKSLEDAVAEAREKGWISFESIKNEFDAR
jgi:hypothetical protein